MIKLKGRTLIFTGKDEKILRQYAKEAKTTPKKFVLEVIKSIVDKYTALEKEITIEKLR